MAQEWWGCPVRLAQPAALWLWLAAFVFTSNISFASAQTSIYSTHFVFESSGGSGGGHSLGEATAMLSGKVDQHFGFQGDVLGGGIGGTDAIGFQGHAWWGDSDWGRIGASASRFGIGSTWGNRFGTEVEWWKGPFTFSASAGVQNGHVSHNGFAAITFRTYLEDDLMISAGGAGWGTNRIARLSTEWRPGVLGSLLGLTLFADAAVGNHSYDHALVGMRFHFNGTGKSLIRLHREDGVPSGLADAIIQGFPARRIDDPSSVSSGGGGGGAPAPPPPPGP